MRYHEYILMRIKEERNLGQQLPIDLPPSDDELIGQTTCGHTTCTTMLPISRAILGCMRIGASTVQEHFCSFDCRDAWREANSQPTYRLL